MTKPRIVETDSGIQGEYDVNLYDRMQRNLRDKGWIETNAIIKSGITAGKAPFSVVILSIPTENLELCKYL